MYNCEINKKLKFFFLISLNTENFRGKFCDLAQSKAGFESSYLTCLWGAGGLWCAKLGDELGQSTW